MQGGALHINMHGCAYMQRQMLLIVRSSIRVDIYQPRGCLGARGQWRAMNHGMYCVHVVLQWLPAVGQLLPALRPLESPGAQDEQVTQELQDHPVR